MKMFMEIYLWCRAHPDGSDAFERAYVLWANRQLRTTEADRQMLMEQVDILLNTIDLAITNTDEDIETEMRLELMGLGGPANAPYNPNVPLPRGAMQ